MGRDFAVQLAQGPLRYVVGLDLVHGDKLDHFVVQADVSGNDPFDHAGITEVVHAFALEAQRSQTGRPHHREVLGRPGRRNSAIESGIDLLCRRRNHEDRGPIGNQPHCLVCTNDLRHCRTPASHRLFRYVFAEQHRSLRNAFSVTCANCHI